MSTKSGAVVAVNSCVMRRYEAGLPPDEDPAAVSRMLGLVRTTFRIHLSPKNGSKSKKSEIVNSGRSQKLSSAKRPQDNRSFVTSLRAPMSIAYRPRRAYRWSIDLSLPRSGRMSTTAPSPQSTLPAYCASAGPPLIMKLISTDRSSLSSLVRLQVSCGSPGRLGGNVGPVAGCGPHAPQTSASDSAVVILRLSFMCPTSASSMRRRGSQVSASLTRVYVTFGIGDCVAQRARQGVRAFLVKPLNAPLYPSHQPGNNCVPHSLRANGSDCLCPLRFRHRPIPFGDWSRGKKSLLTSGGMSQPLGAGNGEKRSR